VLRLYNDGIKWEWNCFDLLTSNQNSFWCNAVATVITSQDYDPGCPLTDDEAIKLNHDGIHAKLASIDISYEPRLFAAAIAEQAHMSHDVSMAAGSVSIDDSACENDLKVKDSFVENHNYA
jgi:hypothetical protein